MWFIKIFLLIFLLSTVTAIEFNCDFTGSYSCKVYNITIDSPDDVFVTKIIGTHAAGKTNNDVNTIDTRGLIIRYFPKNLESFFPNIENIFIESGLYELHQEDLEAFPQLKNLYMSYNHIEYLEKDLFINNPNLQLIYFEVNNIKYVDRNVFDDLTQLTTLSLDRNNCVTGKASGSECDVNDLIQVIVNSCTINANPQVQLINELNEDIEDLLLVNGNLTMNCAKNLFSQNSGSIIQTV
ncbi:hypothetical protein PVAND_000460 [Polypedilum vanderplanki]|uniref:Uncharacterized protein n=1 Tax=Polypedilum vanderplanki TaxID=319348 RepID=A0A9J6BK21_POLVA|nr:hypothetical protein PVAND_000460 [Polypedilum vanderplanki]